MLSAAMGPREIYNSSISARPPSQARVLSNACRSRFARASRSVKFKAGFERRA